MYVPKLNAVLQLREGTTLEKLGKPVERETIPTSKD